MIKKLTSIPTFLFFLFLFLLSSQNVAAQKGTYQCIWNTQGGLPHCKTRNVECNTGYHSGGDCAAINDPSICNSAKFECVEETDCGELGEPCCRTGSPCSDSSLICGGNGFCTVNQSGVPSGGSDVFCPDGVSIDTAIGCIPIQNTNEFIGFILKWAIGIGGGIAFLLIIFAGFQIMTSAGNPERLQAGRELLTSAIAGLILLVFSVFILRIIGVDILKLPGFGG